MTPRKRLLSVLHGEIPDHVPVGPDISNMIPAKLTEKPFWDVYVHEDPPLWKAYIDAIKFFEIDGGLELYSFGDLFGDLGPQGVEKIVHKNEDNSFFTQLYFEKTNSWDKFLTYHTADNPPGTHVLPNKVDLPDIPTTWEDIDNVKKWPKGMELWKVIQEYMGESGVVGMPSGASTLILEQPDDIFAYLETPEKYHEIKNQMIERSEKRLDIISKLDDKPDFLFCGASGSLVWQTPDIFRDIALPVLKHVTKLAKKLNIPTHVHSCGRETELVKMAAEETDLTVIDPLEIPPMGDCNLKELKKLYGNKIVLKGNLHTTEVLLRGTVDDVIEASKNAIDDAAEGGGFILSSGDQCGRDTPHENLRAMVDTARTYGRY